MAVFTNVGNQVDPIKKKSNLNELSGLPDVANFASSKDGIVNEPTTGNTSLDLAKISSAFNIGDITNNNKWANLGVGLLEEIPSVLATRSVKPGEASSIEEAKALEKAKRISTLTTGISTGAQIGSTVGSVVPVIGTAIGAAAGAVLGGIGGLAAGNAQRGKGIAKFRTRENEVSQKEWDENRQKSLQNYLDINSSDRIKKEMDLISQSQGYIT